MRLGLGNTLVKGGGSLNPDGLSLDLQFATDKTLTARKGPTPTFTRASRATQVGATGLIEYAPENLALQSENFGTTWAVNNALTVTSNSVTAPDGTLTADSLNFDTNATSRIIQLAGSNIVSTFSVWLRADAPTTCRLAASAAGSAPNEITVSVTTEWKRFSVVATTWVTGTASFNVRVANNTNGTSGTIYAWGAQLERHTSARTYIPTTTAAVSGARFDHDPITLDCKGLLIEESRTNRAIRSDDFANAAWDQGSARNLTIESDNTTSPSGATDADKLTVGATTTTYNVVQLTPTLTSGVAYTFSAFFKANQITRVSMWTGSSTTLPVDAIFDLTGSGSVVLTSYGTASIQAYSNGWYRCVITGTAGASVLTTLRIGPASGVSRTYVGNSTDSFFAYGAQLETGAFPTSYIPTTSASVVRSADVCSITGSDFTGMYNQPEGTWNVGFTLTSSLTSTEYLIDKNTTGVPILYKATNLIRAGQNNQFQINSATTLVVGSVYKTAFAYKSGDYGLSVNGSTVVTSTYSANAPALPTDIFIGSRSSVAANSPISSIRYYKKRLANSKLQTLTT